jgi:hypothetical protein
MYIPLFQICFIIDYGILVVHITEVEIWSDLITKYNR